MLFHVFWMFALAVWPLLASHCQGQEKINLTGSWHTPDKEHFWSVRQVGDEIWWVVKSKDDGKSWTTSGHGNVSKNKFTGNFADVPLGRNTYYGNINLDLIMEKGKVVRLTGRIHLSGEKPKEFILMPGKG